VRLDVAGETPPAPLPVKIGLYRILQEALSNAVRHGRATRHRITLRCDDQQIVMDVHDNGVGFDVEAVLCDPAPGHFGMKGMQERVQLLGGRFSVASAPGRGTTVTVRIPWR
jgi:signal transduction histidine kinase